MTTSLDSFIDYLFEQNYKKGLQYEKKTPIPGTGLYTNSLNIYVGNQGSGKTYSTMKDIIKICDEGYCHLVLHISDVEDQTVESFKPILKYLTTVELKHVPIEAAERTVKYTIENKKNDEYIVVILDDTSQSPLLRPGSYFNDLFTKCRHIQTSFFLGIHYWRSLTTNIKSNVTTVNIFPGYSKQQFGVISNQIAVNLTYNGLWEIYSHMKKYSRLVIVDSHVFIL